MNNALKDKLKKQYGKEVLVDKDNVPDIEVIPSGIIDIDDGVLGVGGLPEGRIIEIYGESGVAKTTLCLHFCIGAQEKYPDKSILFIDAEHALDLDYAEGLGLNTEQGAFDITQPNSGEEALDVLCDVAAYGPDCGVSLVVVDSVAALTPLAEIESDMGKSNISLQARMMSKAMRKLTATISKSGITVIFINQMRADVNAMFGPKKITTGGKALPFFASVRLELKNMGQKKKGVDVIGHSIKVTAKKNKVAPPFKNKTISVWHGEGLNPVKNNALIAVERGIIHKAGSWFSYNGDKLAQGEDNMLTVLLDNPELYTEIMEQLKNLE